MTAAVCVYPRFVPVARQTLREIGVADVRVATVTNFPHGNDNIEIAVAELKLQWLMVLIVDVVFPYRALMAGNRDVGSETGKSL